jgi:hypothetical protein
MSGNKPGNIVVIAKDFLEYGISGKTRFYSPTLRKGRTKEFLGLYFFLPQYKVPPMKRIYKMYLLKMIVLINNIRTWVSTWVFFM